jgi:translocator protein
MKALLADGGTALIVAGIISFLTAAIGGAQTKIGPWYNNLKVPRWKPPNWAFPVVWTTVFAFITVAIALAWNSAPDDKVRTAIAIVFGVNLVFNMAWSALFFGFQRPDWALIEVVAFWLSIVALIVAVAKASTLAALLLAPYLIWVTVASALNLAIVRLNGPFPNATDQG